MKRETVVKWLKAVTLVGVYGGLFMPVFFWPIVIFPFVFSKLIFLQVLIGLTFPSYLALAWMEPKYRPKWSMLLGAIALYLVAIAASTIFSVDPIRSWWGNQERMNGLFTLLHFFAWLLMAIGVLKTWADWRRLLIYEVLLSAFMATVALLQKPFPKLLSFEAGPRVGGLLDNPIYMGAYQIFNLFFIVFLWLKGNMSRAWKATFVIIALLDIGAFIAAASRGAFLGLAVGCLVFAVTFALTTSNRKARNILLGVLVGGAACYGLLFAFRNTTFVKSTPLVRFTDFSGTIETRLIAWNIAWDGFLERPITGWGFDAFHILFNQKYNPESLRHGYYETWFDRAHNTVLDVLSMTGLFGFVTFAAVWITLVALVVRARRKNWIDPWTTAVFLGLPAGYFVQNLSVFDHPAAFTMSYLLYGLVIVATAGPGFFTNEVPATDPAKQRPLPTVALGILSIAAVLLVWKTSIQPFRASVLSIKSNNAFAQAQYADAFDLAKKAYAIPTPYLDEQSFLQARNYISLAGSSQLQQLLYWREWHDLIVNVNNDLLKAHPRDVHAYFIFARFTDAMSTVIPEDAALADAAYKKTIEFSPKRQQMFFSYSRFLLTQKRPDEAQELLKQAVSFDPEVGEAHWLLGLHLFFDRREYVAGATEIIKARKVLAPYTLQNAQDAAVLAYANEVLGDKEALKAVVQMLPSLPESPSSVYLDIAQVMERSGLMEERNMIVNALARMDSTLAIRLAPLMNGSVTSIAAAMNATINVPTSKAPTPAPTPVATSTGSGPRR